MTIVTLALGITLSVVWEFAEWAGYTYITSGINVGYADTLGDLAAGGLGSLLSGALLASSLTGRQHQISVNTS